MNSHTTRYRGCSSFSKERFSAKLLYAVLICPALFAGTPAASARTSDIASVGDSTPRIDLERVFDQLAVVGVHSDRGMHILQGAIMDAERSQDWGALEVLAWYGYDAAIENDESFRILDHSGSPQAEPDMLDGRRLSMRFLGSAARSLSMKAFQGYKAAAADPKADVSGLFDMKAATKIRGMVDGALRAGEGHHPSDVAVLLGTRANTRRVANWAGDQTLSARWEEQDGDLAASLLALRYDLPRGLMPDDNYFRAARSVLKSSGDLAEMKRLLTKIDRLGTTRESSSFHASVLSDDINLSGDSVGAYSFALEWFLSHPDEAGEGLMSRVASGALSVASSGDAGKIRQTLDLLGAMQTKYASLIARNDLSVAEKMRENRRRLGQPDALYKWEEQKIQCQMAYSRVMLADAIGDPRVHEYAEAFVTEYPLHPGVPSILQILGE